MAAGLGFFSSRNRLPLQVIWLILKDKVKMRDPNQLLPLDFIASERDSMVCGIKPSWN